MAVLSGTLTQQLGYPRTMAAREKNPSLPTPPGFAPLGQAVMETFSEGVVVFDPYGRMLYANQRARHTLDALADGTPHRGENLRDRLMAFGGRARTLKQGSLELGEVVFLPDGGDSPTLAERERQAILDTLEATHGKLAETARRLGISRTTLWRRLRAYGLPANGVHSEFYLPARLDDRLRVATYVGRVGTKSMTLNFDVLRDDPPQLGAAGWMVLVCVDRKRLKPHPLPPRLVAALAPHTLVPAAARATLGITTPPSARASP